MSIDTTAFIAITAMAIVTYLTRIGGLWVMNRVTISPKLEFWLESLPGCILASLVAPAILMNGISEALAGALTAFVAWKSQSFLAALMTGVVSIILLRQVVEII